MTSTFKKVLSLRSGAGRITLISRGSEPDFNPFPSTPADIASVISNLIHSTEISEFQNLGHLKTVSKENLPLLPDGYFWYKNVDNWTIRKWDAAPEVLLDLDVYIKEGALAGYSVSVNKNLIEMFADTRVTPRKPKGKARDSSYGGFSITDFQNTVTTFTDTRGHGLAYVDSADGKSKTNQNINSDRNPRNYSPEKSTKEGGSDLGQHIRNHQLESYTRRNKGAYREVNVFHPMVEQVRCGLFVPSIKHMIRIMPTGASYSQFPQDQDYKLRGGLKTKDLWEQHQTDLRLIPRAQVLDLMNPELETQSMDLEFGFFLKDKSIQQFSDDIRYEIGTQVYFGEDTMRVIVGRKCTNTGFQYSFYNFYRLMSMPVCVYPNLAYYSNTMLKEMEDTERAYVSRFSPVTSRLDSLKKSIEDLSQFLNDQKTSILRILRGGSLKTEEGTPKHLRKTDTLELAKKLEHDIKEAKEFFTEARRELSSYTTLRAELKQEASKILMNQLLKESHSDLPEKEVKDNGYRTMGGICHLVQTHDQKTLETVSGLLDKADYFIQSAQALLQPPKVTV